MAAKLSDKPAMLFLLLLGVINNVSGIASDVTGEPSTGTIANSLNVKVTKTTIRSNVKTFTSMLLPSSTIPTKSADEYTLPSTIMTRVTPSAEASSHLSPTILPSGSQTIMVPSTVASLSLTTLTQSSASPTGSFVSPTQAMASSTQPSLLPTQSFVTLTRSSVTPTRSSVTPTRSSVTPTQSSVSPTKPSMSSTQPSMSPTQPSMSPTQSFVSPTQLSSTLPIQPTSVPTTQTFASSQLSTASSNTSVFNSPTTTPPGRSKAEEDRKLLLYICPPAGLLVLICILIGTILCIRRYRRMRKWRLQLMPLHNLDNADSDEEELLNDEEAPTFQVSDETRQPILTFDD